MGMDMDKLLQQVGQMQEQMQHAQEELALLRPRDRQLRAPQRLPGLVEDQRAHRHMSRTAMPG